MKLENQVCTLEQGKKLETLGITIKPLFCHCHISTSVDDSVKAILPTGFSLKDLPDLATTWIAPAYTVAELGEMLPDESQTFRIGNKWYSDCSHTDFPATKFGTEAEERANLLIYLLENKIVPPRQINERLSTTHQPKIQ